MEYYSGWPHTGPYVRQLKQCYDYFCTYLENLNWDFDIKHSYVILDIDDTVLFTRSLDEDTILSANPYIYNIPSICKQIGLNVIMLTARPYSVQNKLQTEANLNYHGIPFDYLIMDTTGDPDFKIHIRKTIEKHAEENNGQVILQMGDQWNDISFAYNKSLAIKLPCYRNQFYYIKDPTDLMDISC